ncbi:hypothetical protein AnigIFM63309_010600 [Aspergillus niger]|nr:hypothetical protein AnigIFM62618_010485 [Aspergillus niger]GLA42272.1 hypothetical protein AnigIFM63309_010600 [Aspergillus niger]
MLPDYLSSQLGWITTTASFLIFGVGISIGGLVDWYNAAGRYLRHAVVAFDEARSGCWSRKRWQQLWRLDLSDHDVSLHQQSRLFLVVGVCMATGVNRCEGPFYPKCVAAMREKETSRGSSSGVPRADITNEPDPTEVAQKPNNEWAGLQHNAVAWLAF